MAVIDADTHVIESEATWEYFPAGSDVPRPYLIPAEDVRTGLRINRWLIDGQLVPKPEGKGAQRLATPPLDGVDRGVNGVGWEWRALEDPKGRLEDARQRGVDTQVIFPTLFLADLTDDVQLQVALLSFVQPLHGRAVAGMGDQGFRWIVVPPLRSVEETLVELRYAADNGASGVLFHGLEIDRSLGDPYFHPVYKAASECNLAICVHTGPGSITMLNLQDSRYTRNFGHNRVLPLTGFHDLVFNRVPERFPELRVGFLESSASWIPFLMHYFKRSVGASGRDPDFFGPRLFEDYRISIAVEADEDIPYIAQFTGWDHLLIGSDYGHGDQSAELDFTTKLVGRSDIDPDLRRGILETNPAVLYGL